MTQKKKTTYSIVLIAIVILSALFVYSREAGESIFSEYMSYEKETVSFNKLEIPVYLANTPRSRTQGLSNKTHLPENKGMLFVFEQSDAYSFWMKDMKFAIDMIWIDENGKVVFVKENATPESYPALFTPSKPALYVLEVNAGFARENGIAVGSKLDIQF